MSNEEKQTPEINSVNCIEVVTFLNNNNKAAWGRLVMDMFMKITELEVEARVRAEMKPPRPTGMRGATPPGYWPDEIKQFDRGRKNPEDEPVPFNDPGPFEGLRATFGARKRGAPVSVDPMDGVHAMRAALPKGVGYTPNHLDDVQVIVKLAAKHQVCYPCAGIWAAVSEFPYGCKNQGCANEGRVPPPEKDSCDA